MPGALDASMRAVASSLITLFGKTVQIVRDTVAFNPATDIAVVTAGVPVSVVISPPEAYSIREIGGTVGTEKILLGDMRAYLAADNAPFVPGPTQDAVLIDGSNRFKIIAVGPVYSGEMAAMYELLLRR